MGWTKEELKQLHKNMFKFGWTHGIEQPEKEVLIIKPIINTDIKDKAFPSDFPLIKGRHGVLNEFWHKFFTSSNISVILGGRGQGKSTLGFRILEDVRARTGKLCYALGFPNVQLPDYIIKVDDMQQVMGNSFVLIDEAGIAFNSKATFNDKSKYLADMLKTARHDNISVVCITQNSASLDVNIIRLTDTMFFKKPSMLQKFFERAPMKKIFLEAVEYLSEAKGKEEVYIMDDLFTGMVKASLPTFWNNEISTAYKKG